MITVQAIDETSPHFASVKKLWRSHSDTLGFFPEGAFADYARQDHILVALVDAYFAGYLLYRVARDRAVIAHFCISPNARKAGVARELLRQLRLRTSHLAGILLTCDREFEATSSWPRLGFYFNGEIQGRAKRGSVLYRWWLDYGKPDMFSPTLSGDTMLAAMDCNVFLDLVDHEHEETEAMRADWLTPFLTLCYTQELLNDISRNDDDAKRKRRVAEVQQFHMLRCTPDAQQAAEEQLKPLLPAAKTPRDESDFRHVARALAAGADAFVTRDGPLLSCADRVCEACGLLILRPAELVSRIDSIENEQSYERRFVAGTRQVAAQLIGCASEPLLEAIQQHGEKQRIIKAMLDRYIADPRRFQCQQITHMDGSILALTIVDSLSDVLQVPFLRVSAKRQKRTIARAVLTGLVRMAVDSGRKGVLITDASVSDTIRTACADLGFLSVDDGILKIVLRGWLSIADAVSAITFAGESIDRLKAALPDAKLDVTVTSSVEHLIRPAKLSDSSLPCFIVAIQPRFAVQLFDERLARETLFGADIDLALNPESVYYRAAKPSGLESPARVLWYVTKDPSYSGTMSIRACSRIVEIVHGAPKALFSRFRRLGVYEWPDVLETADGKLDGEIEAFRFDDTELLRPVPWAQFQAILTLHGICNHQLQSPLRISSDAFGEIYAAALDPTAIR